MKSFLPFVLVVGLVLAGCGVPKDLASIQGEWKFDEDQFLETMKRESKSDKDWEASRAVYETVKTKGFATMSDLSVMGTRIIALNGLQQQWDLAQYKLDGSRLHSKATWYEDRNTPWKKKMPMELLFELNGRDMFLTMKWEGVEEHYLFHKL